MKIAHISDLHLSSPHYIPEWGSNVAEIISQIKPDLLIVTGDLTEEGYFHEFNIAKKYIDRLNIKNKVIIPGNHDARNKGYEIFESLFGTRYPYFENNQVVVFGVDSTAPDLDDGHIGRENYPTIQKKFSKKAKVKILAMHHHLIPIPGTGRERHIPVDAGDVLNVLTDLGVNFVFSGHRHQPWIWKLNDMYVITVGTACSRRLKVISYPSYNIMEIKGKCCN